MSNLASELHDRVRSREAVVGVVGLGYVGLPTVRAFHDAGFRVVGFDIDPAKPVMLREGKAYLAHLGQELFDSLARSDRFSATDVPGGLRDCDAVFICVPTPLDVAHQPDLTYVRESSRMVAGVLKRGGLVVLTSTSYPGTTREVSGGALSEHGFVIGESAFLAFSPEREDPGRPGVQTRTIPRLVGGCDAISGSLARELLATAIEHVIEVESAEVAEAAKLLENIYRAVNIALVNELKPALAAMGIDIWQVIEAAATKPFGFQAFYPGPGLGGHCIPIDPFYLSWVARRFGQDTRFIELAGEINRRMPHDVVEALGVALNDDRKALNGARVLVIGVAYKPNIDDIRESPAAEIITRLLDMGADVSYHDPHVAVFPRMKRYSIDLKSVALTPSDVSVADAVLIVTDHKAVDYRLLGQHARLIVDTRNAMAKHAGGAVKARVVKA